MPLSIYVQCQEQLQIKVEKQLLLNYQLKHLFCFLACFCHSSFLSFSILHFFYLFISLFFILSFSLPSFSLPGCFLSLFSPPYTPTFISMLYLQGKNKDPSKPLCESLKAFGECRSEKFYVMIIILIKQIKILQPFTLLITLGN